MHKYSLFILAILILGCTARREYEPVSNDSIPLSYLSFRIKFPVTEIQNGINEVIPKVIMDDDLPLGGQDELHLKIERDGDLNLAIRNTTVYGSLPLKIDVGITKSILGLKFSNRDSPIGFSGTIKLSSEISLDDQWNLLLDCDWLGIEWKENPEMNVFGVTIDLKDLVVRALEEHEDEITLAICGEIESSIKLGENIEKMWKQMQSPIRIAKEPAEIWLYFKPEVLNGQLVPYERDTLAIHLEYRTEINITTNPPLNIKAVPFPGRKDPLTIKPKMIAYAKVQLPMNFVRERVIYETEGQEFEYRGYRSKITQAEVSGMDNRLAINFRVQGDIDSEFKVGGVPYLTDDLKLVLDDFEYDIETNNVWITVTDVLFHPFIEDFLADQVIIDMDTLLNRLDSLAMNGIAKTDLGKKIKPHFEFNRFQSDQLSISEDTLSWFIDVEGYLDLQLKQGLFKKK